MKSKSKGRGYLPIVTLLGIMLIVNAIVFSARIGGGRKVYVTEYSELMQELRSGDYAGLVDSVRNNQGREAETQQDMSEFEHFADFYEAAMLYRAYENTGDEERAQAQLIKMQAQQQYLVDEEFVTAMEKLME